MQHMLIGSRLGPILARQAVSQRELAERLGVDESQVSRWAQNQRAPYARTRRAIAEALGVDPAELLSGEVEDVAA